MRYCVALLLLLFTSLSFALDVELVEGVDYIDVLHQKRLIRVQRIQDQSHRLSGSFSKTSRKCPPFCIQPEHAAPGVVTFAEPDIFNFMANQIRSETGLLVDARVPAWFQRGTIPGSINIPFTTFSLPADAPKLVKAMHRFGVTRRGQVGGLKRQLERWGLMDGDRKTDHWDFVAAKEVVFWCNGPWCSQSPRAIRGLLALGYPADKIFYYRGGMQMWQILGLTTIVPKVSN
ncbi:MAG: rhodanese-like domain-containing protein [Gammaproteobacteria bacterium]|nr:rhodanese-like domain-containing protein [Gammaproteobacteria bacterium]